MSISIQMVLVAKYDKENHLWRATVKHLHGDDYYKNYVGEGGSPDEARGHLLREMILAGLSDEPIYIDVETEE